jgi:hypothetical protein
VRKLCERPGCGASAEVSYGIDNASLTVWVDNRAILEREHAGRLCRRHADALVVPRGWTIDDRRQAVPQLFRVVEAEPEKKRAPRSETAAKKTVKREKRDDGPSLFESIEAELEEIEKAKVVDPDETQAIPWSPRLVVSDDSTDDNDDQPVFGRLLGRAFGKKPQE